MRRSVLILSLLFAPVAIAQTGGASIGTQIATSQYHEGMKIELVAIDGNAVDSGSSMWSDDQNLSYPLTAGSHTLTLNIMAGAANEKMDAVVFVADGQQYSLGAETVLNQQTQEPSSYIAWVQDSSGNRVWNRQFNLISKTVQIPSPWQH